MKKVFIYSFLTLFLVVTTVISLKAQPHAGQQSTTGTVTGDRIGAGAGVPITDGSFILMTLGMAFAGRKWHVLYKKRSPKARRKDSTARVNI